MHFHGFKLPFRLFFFAIVEMIKRMDGKYDWGRMFFLASSVLFQFVCISKKLRKNVGFVDFNWILLLYLKGIVYDNTTFDSRSLFQITGSYSYQVIRLFQVILQAYFFVFQQQNKAFLTSSYDGTYYSNILQWYNDLYICNKMFVFNFFFKSWFRWIDLFTDLAPILVINALDVEST